MHAYTYSILRFTPDIRTGEFINVGIAAFSASDKEALIKCRDTVERVTKLNPSVNAHGLTSMLKATTTAFNARSVKLSDELAFNKTDNVGDICDAVLPKDDSSLQWSPVLFGRCKDLSKEIKRLSERLVTYADEPPTQQPHPQ